MQQRIIVTLVHGTWGRGIFPDKRLKFWVQRQPIWTEPYSPFYSELEHSLKEAGYDPHIVTYLWSGANSVIERDAVAQKLATELDRQSEQEPQTDQIVIGHSHGGNIILSAARYYRHATTPIHLITIATPFLDVMRVVDKGEGKYVADLKSEWLRSFDIAQSMKNLKVHIFSALITYLVSEALTWIGLSAFEIRSGMTDIQFIPILILMLIIEIISTKLAWKYEDALERVAMFNTSPGHGASAIRLLVLRGTDDEAALALAAGSLHTLLISHLVSFLGYLSAWTSIFFSTLLSIVFTVVNDSWKIYILDILFVFIGVGILFLFFSGIEALWASSFGREFLVGGTMIRIYSNSAPDSVCDMHIRTLPGKSAKQHGLRHSLYEHELCIPSIISWLNVSTKVGYGIRSNPNDKYDTHD